MLYFIAIITPDDIDRQIKEWKNYMREQFHCKVALKSPAHITLIPPFTMAETAQPEIQILLEPYAASQQRFSIRLKNFAAFKPRVIYANVLPNTALNALQTSLEATLLQSGRFPIKKEDRPFHPHITIANRDLQKQDFPLAWQHFQQINYERSFTANAISLLKNNEHSWQIAATFPFGY